MIIAFPDGKMRQREITADPIGERSRACGRPVFLALVFLGRGYPPAQDVCLEIWRRSVHHEPDLLVELGSKCLALAFSDPLSIATDSRRGRLLLLYGEVYGGDGEGGAKRVLDDYGKRGLVALTDIEGSYALILADAYEDRIMVATDHLCSRRIFCRAFSEGYWLSNSLDVLPMGETSLDVVGVASFLANGAIINNRTVYKGVTVLDGAILHEFREDGIRRERYFDYQFNHELEGVDEANLREELSELLTRAVEKRAEDEEEIYISLSGGYESSAILGILSLRLKRPGVRCFSYGLDGYITGSDALCAREMASLAGAEHFFIRSYDGDAIGNINLNAALGEGMAHPCDEATVWRGLREGMGNSSGRKALFVGDSPLYYSDLTSHSAEEALNVVKIQDFSALSWLRESLEKDAFHAMHVGLRHEFEAVQGRAGGCSACTGDAEFFFYLDQRLAHVIMPWREYFCGSAMRIRNPILDRDLLEFYKRLPKHLRSKRALYIDTVRWMFPELYRIPRARLLNSAPDWRREFIAHAEEIRHELLSECSPLDELIPRESIQGLIGGLSRGLIGMGVDAAAKAISWMAVRLPAGPAKLARKRRSRHASSPVDTVVFLYRVLILRTFLARNKARR